MNQVRLLAAALALSFLSLASCSDAPPPPAQKAPVAAAPESPPSSEPAPKASEAQTAAATETTTLDPRLRGGVKRDSGAKTLDTGYDLSKVQPAAKESDSGHSADDGHDHGAEDAHDHSADDGHDHGEPAVVQDGSSLLPAAQAQKLNGRIELRDGSNQVQDLGKLRQGDAVDHEFLFVSQGEGPLIVSGVKPSCGCTKADVVLVAEDGTRSPYTKGDPIPVGQKFLLSTTISTDGKPGGPFSAQVSLYGNDSRGVFNVRMTAEIEPIVAITPNSSVFFGRMTTADQRDQTVTVSSTRGEPFLLTLAQELTQLPLKLELTPKAPDADGRSSEWTVKVAIGPSTEVGLRSYPINLRTDIPIAKPKYPSKDGTPQMHGFMLNVQAQITGMVSAEPAFLTFGMVRPADPVERSLRLECHDDFKLTADMPVAIEGLQGQEFPYKDAISVTVEPLEEGRTATVRVRLSGLPADMNGSFGGILRLKIQHPHMAEIEVRFSGVCRPPLPAQTGVPQSVTLQAGAPSPAAPTPAAPAPK